MCACVRVCVCTDRNLKVHHLLGKRRHLVVEAERILARLVGREDKVALALLLAVHDLLVAGALDGVVHVKRTASLDLYVYKKNNIMEHHEVIDKSANVLPLFLLPREKKKRK